MKFTQYLNENKIVVDSNNTLINSKNFDKGDVIYLNEKGQFHREDGPAIEYPDGTKYWYINGIKHRDDGPAVEYVDGTIAWYKNGHFHNIHGPAVGTLWAINGKPPEAWTEKEIKLLADNNKILDLIKYPEVLKKLKEFIHILSPKQKLALDVDTRNKI